MFDWLYCNYCSMHYHRGQRFLATAGCPIPSHPFPVSLLSKIHLVHGAQLSMDRRHTHTQHLYSQATVGQVIATVVDHGTPDTRVCIITVVLVSDGRVTVAYIIRSYSCSPWDRNRAFFWKLYRLPSFHTSHARPSRQPWKSIHSLYSQRNPKFINTVSWHALPRYKTSRASYLLPCELA